MFDDECYEVYVRCMEEEAALAFAGCMAICADWVGSCLLGCTIVCGAGMWLGPLGWAACAACLAGCAGTFTHCIWLCNRNRECDENYCAWRYHCCLADKGLGPSPGDFKCRKALPMPPIQGWTGEWES